MYGPVMSTCKQAECETIPDGTVVQLSSVCGVVRCVEENYLAIQVMYCNNIPKKDPIIELAILNFPIVQHIQITNLDTPRQIQDNNGLTTKVPCLFFNRVKAWFTPVLA
jgi:hypothetical protein